jgi:hypothetical protein
VTKDELELAPMASKPGTKDMSRARKDSQKDGVPKQPAYNFGTTHSRVFLEVHQKY